MAWAPHSSAVAPGPEPEPDPESESDPEPEPDPDPVPDPEPAPEPAPVEEGPVAPPLHAATIDTEATTARTTEDDARRIEPMYHRRSA